MSGLHENNNIGSRPTKPLDQLLNTQPRDAKRGTALAFLRLRLIRANLLILSWLPPRDSNPDLLIQTYFADSENKQDPGFGSAKSGKLWQDPHPQTHQKRVLIREQTLAPN